MSDLFVLCFVQFNFYLDGLIYLFFSCKMFFYYGFYLYHANHSSSIHTDFD